MNHDHTRSPHIDADRPAINLVRAALATPDERARFDTLMGLLETPHDDGLARRTALIEATVGVVAASRDADRTARLGHRSPLAPADAARVDRWVEGGPDDRLERLVTLLDVPADDARDGRIARTLDTIQRGVDYQSERLRLDPSHDRLTLRRRFRLADLGAIAAAVVIVASITVPALTNFQTNTWAAQSTANLQQASFASSLFAADHDGRVPHARHDPPASGPTQWWLVGDASQSHSAQLFSLVKHHYVTLNVLNAPGNTRAPQSTEQVGEADWVNQEQVSYSYRLFDHQAPPTIVNLSRSILLSDRSPVVRQAIETGAIDASANSDNFDGKGQHVAFGDGSVMFLSSPWLPGGDNLWLPRRAEATGTLSLRGDERPDGPDDQFVGP